MAEVTIEATRDGPYLVSGTIELHDTDGNVVPTRGKTWLCRCGASTKKPFCDGTHSRRCRNPPTRAEPLPSPGAGSIPLPMEPRPR